MVKLSTPVSSNVLFYQLQTQRFSAYYDIKQIKEGKLTFLTFLALKLLYCIIVLILQLYLQSVDMFISTQSIDH